MKKKLVGIIFLCFLLLNNMVICASEDIDNPDASIKAQVIKILSDEVKQLGDYGGSLRVQQLKLKILEGKLKGELVEGENNVQQDMAYQTVVKEGQKVLIGFNLDENGKRAKAYIKEIVRENSVYWLVAIFVLIIVIVGGIKGIKSLISLVVISIMILKFMLPRILQGENPVGLSIITAIFATVITLVLISGFNKKTVASIIGTVGGVLCSGIVAFFFSHMAELTGLSMQEAQFLMFIPQKIQFDFKGLLLAGIILGALGAVMDVSMSIASSIKEIHNVNKTLKISQLFKSGMNVGKDVMGTMSNTLILAYTGASMNLMLLYMAHSTPWVDIINRDIIASEIVRALAGTIGLVFTIPITAIIASYLYKFSNTKDIETPKEVEME